MDANILRKKNVSCGRLNMQKLKAIFKDDSVRCEKCGTEIWEDVDCDCGVDGSDHEGLKGAYEEKAKAEIEVWSAEDEIIYAPLRQKKLRVEARKRRDKTRVRKFSHRMR